MLVAATTRSSCCTWPLPTHDTPATNRRRSLQWHQGGLQTDFLRAYTHSTRLHSHSDTIVYEVALVVVPFLRPHLAGIHPHRHVVFLPRVDSRGVRPVHARAVL